MSWTIPDRNTISLQKKDPGTSYEGIFQGTKTVKTELGDTVIYNFVDDEDRPFGVWAFASLNFQMDGVQVGTRCKLTYNGKSKTKNKYGKFPHLAKVEIWKEENDSIKETEEEKIPF